MVSLKEKHLIGRDVAFYPVYSSVVLAGNTHRNYTKTTNFRSKIRRKIREERIFARNIGTNYQ